MLKINIIFNLLKIIAVISFFWIGGLSDDSYPFFAITFINLPLFFSHPLDYLNLNNADNVIRVLILFTILTMLVYVLTKRYRDRYLFILCAISILISITIISLYAYPKPDNIRILNPFSIFTSLYILSSIGLIILNFKKTIKK
ncbi:hypothetical protein CMU71_02875 [Elizabethkingia anophelis]|nr:hypothetical protein NV63_00205 [Elizabethkingia anophelis]MDV3565837.1 hypothetical protein [Elizabethkingia anophelis]MDV3878131.1 hypothetical protein [Elizabethkingia anophelis]MDV3972011.1 hypothetical protein [Elizabethkingia anophelis]OPC37652.1 hypothetical protein BAX98_00335 [Elizabethkingia anophelis]